MAPHTSPQPPPPPPRVLTLGVELEMAMFDNVTYEAVAQLLRAAGLKAEVGPYDREKPDPWRVTVDHSVASEEDLRRYRQPVTLQKYFERLGHPTLKGPIYVPAVKVPRPANDASSKRRTLPTEIISPPFEDDQGQKTAHWHRQVQIALDAVNAGPYDLETNRTTGFHVHIGAGLQPDQVFTVDEVKKIAALYLAYEKRIDKLHPEHRLDDWFARSQVVHSAFSDIERPGALILAIGSMEELVRSMCPPDVTSPIPEIPDEEQSVSGDSDSEQPTKYYKLNLVGLLDQHRTIEFRQHQGTTIPIVVQRWADFTLAFVRKALTISEEELVELSVDGNASIFDDPLLRRAFYGAEADQ